MQKAAAAAAAMGCVLARSSSLQESHMGNPWPLSPPSVNTKTQRQDAREQRPRRTHAGARRRTHKVRTASRGATRLDLEYS